MTIAVRLRNTEAAQQECVCPVCLDTLSDTVFVRGCMHRFCEACLMGALRHQQGNEKRCPTCREPIASKRHLIRDVKFDEIVTVITKLASSSSSNAAETRKNNFAREFAQRARLLRERQLKLSRNFDEASVNSSSAQSQQLSAERAEDGMAPIRRQVTMLRIPQLNDRVLRVPDRTTIAQLLTYVKAQLPQANGLRLRLKQRSDLPLLPEILTVRDVRESIDATVLTLEVALATSNTSARP
ncbi:MAG: hypothetical protein MHM6MM_005087 [Cercozoa sp. M6MM]